MHVLPSIINTGSVQAASRLGIVAGVFAIVALAVPAPDVLAAGPDVKVASVSCATSPEVVEIKNFGDGSQSLAGWKLESDPVASESYDLTPAGSIPAGGSIFIESGPGAAATFKWSTSEVFRNGDAADFVRLVDNNGQPHGVIACAQATPTPQPAASPTPVNPGIVPNGGGPPGPSGEVLSPLVLIYAGGTFIGATLGLSLAWFGISLGTKRRPESETAEDTSTPLAEPIVKQIAPAPPRASRKRPKAPARPLLLALILALAAAILVAFLVQTQDSSRRR